MYDFVLLVLFSAILLKIIGSNIRFGMKSISATLSWMRLLDLTNWSNQMSECRTKTTIGSVFFFPLVYVSIFMWLHINR